MLNYADRTQLELACGKLVLQKNIGLGGGCASQLNDGILSERAGFESREALGIFHFRIALNLVSMGIRLSQRM